MAKNFMIVDDSIIIQKNLQKQLTTAGDIVVYIANDGLEALEYYKDNPESIDIITLDISMPKLNGLDTLKELIQFDKNVIVYMVTSHGEESVVIDAIDIGAAGYILKPLTQEKINQLTKEVEENEL